MNMKRLLFACIVGLFAALSLPAVAVDTGWNGMSLTITAGPVPTVDAPAVIVTDTGSLPANLDASIGTKGINAMSSGGTTAYGDHDHIAAAGPGDDDEENDISSQPVGGLASCESVDSTMATATFIFDIA